MERIYKINCNEYLIYLFFFYQKNNKQKKHTNDDKEQRIKHHKPQKSLCKARSRNIPFIFNSHTLNIFHWAQASEIKLFPLGYFYSCFQIHFFFLFPRMFFSFVCFRLEFFPYFHIHLFCFHLEFFFLFTFTFSFFIYLYIFFSRFHVHFFLSLKL